MGTGSDAPGDTATHTELLGKLLPLAVHALAQPVNILQGYSDLLPGIDDRPDQRSRALLAIAHASQRLGDILAELRRAGTSAQVATELIRRYSIGDAGTPAGSPNPPGNP